MTGKQSLIPVGKPLAPSSCKMLRILLDGPATTLDLKARMPDAARATISSHPSQLITAGLVRHAGREGRYVLYAITERGRRVLLAMGVYERALLAIKRAWRQQ